jgi:Ca-activated chloride channel family protein
MSFEHPILFFILLLPTIAFAYLVLTNKNGLERVFSPTILKEIKVEGEHLSTRARNILLFLSIFFMIIAISHPFIKKGNINVTIGGQSIVVALNISSSMRSKDRYPNRLEFAKLKLNELFELMPNDEISLLAFADNTYLLSPGTTDKETLKEILLSLDSKYLKGKANYTKLANALKKTLKNKIERSAIIVTDNDENANLELFEKILKKYGIKLYIIYVATKDGAPLVDEKGKFLEKNGEFLISRLSTKLGELAKKYEGDYVIADYSNKNIKELVEKIKENSIVMSEEKELTIKQRVELFYFPMIISFILLISALSSIPKNSSKSREKR